MIALRLLFAVPLAGALLVIAPASRAARGASPAPQAAPAQEATKGKDVLIVFLSRTGNTEVVAKIIQEEVGGDLVELELVTPYPRDYKKIVEQVHRENEAGHLPPLATRIKNIKEYETVFLGFPTWDMQLPPPMKSFLKHHDLRGKTVVPFNTNAGYGVGSGFRDVASRASGAKVLQGISVEGGHEKAGIHLAIKDGKARQVRSEIRKWLKLIGVR